MSDDDDERYDAALSAETMDVEGGGGAGPPADPELLNDMAVEELLRNDLETFDAQRSASGPSVAHGQPVVGPLVPVQQGNVDLAALPTGRARRGARGRDVVRVTPITRSDPSFAKARDQLNVGAYNIQSDESARMINKAVRDIISNARAKNTLPNRPREDNCTLRDAQKQSLLQVVDQQNVAIAALATYCRHDESANEEGLYRSFDRYRILLNESEPGSGKSLEVAVRRFFSPHERWMNLCRERLPTWAYEAMQVHPRVCYLTTENGHKPEIIKEGLDPKVYAPKHVTAAQRSIFEGRHNTIKAPMVTRASGLAIPYDSVRKFAKRTLVDEGGKKLDIAEFANAWQYAVTSQKLVNHIVAGRLRDGDFAEINLEEAHTHKNPAELAVLSNGSGGRAHDHSLIVHTFRTAWIVCISGTPPDWCKTGFYPWHDDPSQRRMIVPRTIASCLYGELYLDGIVCRVNVVNLELMGTFTLDQDGTRVAIDLSQPLDDAQTIAVTYSPQIWYVILQVEFGFLVERIKERKFLQQGILFTPEARIAEEGAVEQEDRERDQKLPLKFWEMGQSVLAKWPDKFIHPYRNGEQIVTSFVMADAKKVVIDGMAHDNARVIEAFCKHKTTDYVMSQSIMRAGVDNETVVHIIDLVAHKPEATASVGSMWQGLCRADRRTFGNQQTRQACRAHGCEEGLNAFLAHHSILGTNGKPLHPEDCYAHGAQDTTRTTWRSFAASSGARAPRAPRSWSAPWPCRPAQAWPTRWCRLRRPPAHCRPVRRCRRLWRAGAAGRGAGRGRGTGAHAGGGERSAPRPTPRRRAAAAAESDAQGRGGGGGGGWRSGSAPTRARERTKEPTLKFAGGGHQAGRRARGRPDGAARDPSRWSSRRRRA